MSTSLMSNSQYQEKLQYQNKTNNDMSNQQNAGVLNTFYQVGHVSYIAFYAIIVITWEIFASVHMPIFEFT